MHQDSSAPADAAKLKKMLDGFKIPAAGEEPFFLILELGAAGAMQHFLCGGMILFGRLESSGWRQLWDCVWWRVQGHTRIWGIQHSKKNLYNVDAFINFCHVYFLCICLLSPFTLVPQIAGLFQATDPSRQA